LVLDTASGAAFWQQGFFHPWLPARQCSRLLPAVAAIQAESERIGIVIKTGVDVKEVVKVDNRFQVIYEIDGIQHTVDADRVVNGAGRVANVDALDLDAANIKHDRVAIDVDDYLRSTSNPAIWVAGDSLVQSPQLSPIATLEGRIVGQNIVNGPTVKPDYRIIPSNVYTVPALSTVGLSEQEASDKNLSVRVATSDMTEWFSGKSYGEKVAFAKVLIDEDSDQIVGAHMVGHQGEELIHLFAMAMRHGITASTLKEDMYAFPTFSSDIKNML
jgi:glutathione reductase (NADPH)